MIPQPATVQERSGQFTITPETQILVTKGAEDVGAYLAGLLRPSTGYALLVQEMMGETAVNHPVSTIILSLTNDHKHNEAYALDATPERIEIRAAAPNGLFYGVQTLRQLLPPESESQTVVEGMNWTITAVFIQDQPRFPWRGMHLDVARHFFPVTFIKKYIDLLALHKLNVLHLHLTDDQGWRIEIKQYPRLTKIGSQRATTPIPSRPEQQDGQPYGGFYTQDDIREIVAHAATRFITVVPEIDVPGHMLAALTAYPELGCRGEGYAVWTKWGVSEDVCCAGKEATYTFLENVFTEILDLFPSESIHIGGDECPKARWRECPHCQAKMKAEGLPDEAALQSYFVRRIERFLNENGRRLIGWDEILEGGIAPNAVVMKWRSWLDEDPALAAVNAGHDVIMTPIDHCYFNYYQTEVWDNEPPAHRNTMLLEKVYAFDPMTGIPPDKAEYVLGGQGNVWTEYLALPSDIEFATFPRACALAEKVWSMPACTDYDDFLARLAIHFNRLDVMAVVKRPLSVNA